jgi:hypothetical protein
MNTKQIRLTTTASTRVNTNTTTARKNTTLTREKKEVYCVILDYALVR